MVANHQACMSLCQRTDNCQAFTYFQREGTPNCFMKTGLLTKACHTGDVFTFSRKCSLTNECSADKATCGVSKIPFSVAGPQKWNCADDNGDKTCTLACQDDYDLGMNGPVSASCDASSNTWNLDSSVEHLDVSKPGCQTCSADPSDQYPIGHGGRWECVNKNKWNPKKKCTPKCDSTNKVLRGAVSCKRKNMGTSEGRNAPSNNFVQDNAMKKYIKKTGSLTCELDTCKESEFAAIMSDYAIQKEWDVSLDNTNFNFAIGSTAYRAYLKCPNSDKQSKTMCTCKIQGGHRRFWCKDLRVAQNC